MKRPVVIIGGLAARHRERVRELVRNAPVYAEPLSGLREHSTITAGERMIALTMAAGAETEDARVLETPRAARSRTTGAVWRGSSTW